MHTKEYNGIEIKYPGPDLHQEEIDSLMSFLHNQIEDVDSYSDKSLFFQNPQIIDGWLALVQAIVKLETWEAAEDKTKWEDRTETYVAYLLTLRDYHLKYVHLGQEYYAHLKDLLDTYGGWLEGECISADGIEALSFDKYIEDIDDTEDIIQYLTKLNSDSLKARSAVHSVLTDILEILLAIINRGGQKIIELNPSMEDFAKAIDDDIKEWTYSFRESIFEDMKEDLIRHYKEYRTAPYTPELWGELLSADEHALFMASKQQLAKCNEVKQEHWGEDMRLKMDENGELMYLIYSSCRTEKLFNLGQTDSLQKLIGLLTSDNLSLFYEIIVRRNLIQCEMFPELKKQHEEWLNGGNEQTCEGETIEPQQILPDVLASEQAMKYWERLKEQNFVDENYMLLESTTNRQAMYIAEPFAEKLNITSKWKTFEDFWRIKHLAQEKNKFHDDGKSPSRSRDIDQIFED